MKREIIETIIADLRAGRAPKLSVADFPAFSEEATAGDPHIGPEKLAAIAATLFTTAFAVSEEFREAALELARTVTGHYTQLDIRRAP